MAKNEQTKEFEGNVENYTGKQTEENPKMEDGSSVYTLTFSYRNQSIYLLRKSIDWFLYDNGLHLERVKYVRSQVTWKHSAGEEFQWLAEQRKQLLEYALLPHIGFAKEKSYYLSE